MSLARITLESFAGDDAPKPEESPEYLRGFADGLAKAAQSADAERQQNLSEIATALADMTFGFVEARSYLLDRIRPLMAQISGLVLPQAVEATFAAHLTDTLSDYFDEVLHDPVRISIAPDLLDDIQPTLTSQHSEFQLSGDPNLTSGQAILQRGDTHIMIDLPALIAALRVALDGIEPSERTQTHG